MDQFQQNPPTASFRGLLLAAGVDPDNYTSHSIRICRCRATGLADIGHGSAVQRLLQALYCNTTVHSHPGITTTSGPDRLGNVVRCWITVSQQRLDGVWKWAEASASLWGQFGRIAYWSVALTDINKNNCGITTLTFVFTKRLPATQQGGQGNQQTDVCLHIIIMLITPTWGWLRAEHRGCRFCPAFHIPKIMHTSIANCTVS